MRPKLWDQNILIINQLIMEDPNPTNWDEISPAHMDAEGTFKYI